MRDAQRVVIAVHRRRKVGERLSGVPEWPACNQLVAKRCPRQVARDVHTEWKCGEREEDERRLSRQREESEQRSRSCVAPRNAAGAIDGCACRDKEQHQHGGERQVWNTGGTVSHGECWR